MPRLTAIRRQALDEMMKEAIFNAAIRVLSEHGVTGMTMDRVALAAGMAKGSLYNYFRSKKELLEFVYGKTIEPVFQDLIQTVATDRPAVEKLAAHFRTLLEHSARHSRVFHLLFHDDTAQGLLQSTQRTSRETGCQHLAEIFRQGIAEGVFRPADPLVLARMFIGLCRGAFDGRPQLEEVDQRDEVYRLVMEAFLNGIADEKVQVG